MTRYFATVAAMVCWPLLAPSVFPGSEAQSISAQVEPELSYENRFVETRGIRLQYADFGGSGLPVVFVQGIHDFSPEEQPYSALLSRLADEFRLLAPVRRGHGGSDDTVWGYDVATQAEDLLGLMDALGIRRAVLVGGPPAPQEMTWIAEHHPERLAGLVFLANPHVEPDFREPEVRAFAENYWRGSCDLGETAVARIGPRAAWRPHFLEDETARIDVPALRFFWPGSTLRSMDLNRLDRVEQMAASEPACDGEAAAREYFAALAADEERLAVLRHALTESDRSVVVDSAMARAFGSKLRTVVAGDLGDPNVDDFVFPHMRRFIEEVADIEAGGSEGAAADTIVGRVVHVAPPTGEREADRMSIMTALDQAGPGDTIQFAPGTYLLGGSIRVSVPGVTLLGSDDGTILRGCDPTERVDYEPMTRRCAGLELTRGHQTVRGFTFERMSWTSLQIVGVQSDVQQSSVAITEGGHLIENNTFRDSDRFDVISDAAEPIVIRNNTFINTYHAVDIRGRNVHFLNNEISAPAPSRIPYGRADIAIVVGQFDPAGPPCANNLVAGNRIHGHPDGIAILVFAPGMSCRGNEVRNNTIRVGRVALAGPDRGWKGQEADSVQVGIALRLRNYAGWCRTAPADQEWAFCPRDEGGQDAALVDNNFEGNRIIGGEGIAIELLHASRNRVVGNTISGIEPWDRFPDGVLYLSEWRAANGSAIWVSPGSSGNEIIDNAFDDIASAAVFLEGDSNRVVLQEVGDVVRDLGTDNLVVVAGGDAVNE